MDHLEKQKKQNFTLTQKNKKNKSQYIRFNYKNEFYKYGNSEDSLRPKNYIDYLLDDFKEDLLLKKPIDILRYKPLVNVFSRKKKKLGININIDNNFNFVSQFIQYMIIDGKKEKALKIMQETLNEINKNKTTNDSVDIIIKQAVQFIRPVFSLKKRNSRVIMVSLSLVNQNKFGCKFILKSCKKQKFHKIYKKLAFEILAIYNKSANSYAIKDLRNYYTQAKSQRYN